MNFVSMIATRIYVLSTLALLATGQPIFAQPTQQDIARAISAHLPGFARLGDFDYRVFESNQPGVGRVAISGHIRYNQDIIRRTRQMLFAPSGMSQDIRGIIFQMANVDPRSNGWRTVLPAGRNIEISGNLLYEERVNDFAWEYQISVNAPDGIVASRLPSGDYIIGSDGHSRLLDRINGAMEEVQELQANFVSFAEREILGGRFSFLNECAEYTFFTLDIQQEPKKVMVRDLTGSGDFFGSRNELEWRGLAEIVVWADYDFSRSNAPYVPPNWARDAGGRIAFSFHIRFERNGQISFELDRKVAWEATDGLSTSINTNFVGRWVASGDFIGFRNGSMERCVRVALRRVQRGLGERKDTQSDNSRVAGTGSATGDDLLGEIRDTSWTGMMSQGSQAYPIEIVSQTDNIYVTYPSLPCSGVWEVIETSSSSLLFREVIHDGTDICVNSGIITLTQDESGALEVAWAPSRNARAAAHAILSEK